MYDGGWQGSKIGKKKNFRTQRSVYSIPRLYRLPLSKPKSVRVYKNPIRANSKGEEANGRKLRTEKKKRRRKNIQQLLFSIFRYVLGMT